MDPPRREEVPFIACVPLLAIFPQLKDIGGEGGKKIDRTKIIPQSVQNSVDELHKIWSSQRLMCDG